MPTNSVPLSDLEKAARAPVVSALEKVEPERIRLDVDEVFLLYATLCGDKEACAATLGVSAVHVAVLAAEHGWDERIAPIIARKKSRRPGDVERAINRAHNFVIAHRYRTFLERAMRIMVGWSDAELHENLCQNINDPDNPAVKRLTKIQSRCLADFAVALQKCAEMTYSALADTSPERNKRKENAEADEVGLDALHAQLSRGMGGVGAPKSAVAELAEAQLARAQAQASGAVIVEVPGTSA